jgi:isocitrate dehydrogenase
MLKHIGWDEAARAASDGINSAIKSGEMTGDLARWVPGAKSLPCSAFAEAVRRRIKV